MGAGLDGGMRGGKSERYFRDNVVISCASSVCENVHSSIIWLGWGAFHWQLRSLDVRLENN